MCNKSICFYFQVHQPYRVNEFSVFDHGTDKKYFTGPNQQSNYDVFKKVAEKCYLPSNKLMLKLIKKHPEFKISYSLSGVFLEQCLEFGEIGKSVLDSFQKLVATGNVELLSETYYHSLSALYSKEEFAKQILKHQKLIQKLFKVTPKVFRNTELIYNNEISQFIKQLGFNGIISEGWDPVLKGESPSTIHEPPEFKFDNGTKDVLKKYNFNPLQENFGILLKHYKLSDDIAFRFSNKHWSEHPLTTEKFVHWAKETPGRTINLFMDYETFGEHQWEDTGIFKFLEHLPKAAQNANIEFHTPTEALIADQFRKILDVHHHLSWADSERDLSAWLDNPMQKSSMQRVFELEHKVNQIDNPETTDTWRKLQTSDHFYYMCTKYWSDGDVHAYFSPFNSPYEAYINFINILHDFTNKVNQQHQVCISA